MNSITKRWVRGSLFFTLAVVLVAEAIFLYYVVNDYYNGVSGVIKNEFTTINSRLSLFSSASSEEKALRLFRSLEEFEEKTHFEVMLINVWGQVVSTTSGVLPTTQAITSDIVKALQSEFEDMALYIGDNENGEKIMSGTMRTPYSSGGIVAIRIVTSLTKVDRTIWNLVIASILFLLIIILASVVSGLYFIRSIVMPLQKVEATAARIAQGDFETRIENKNNDEIGSLCKTINYMAEELSKSERMKNEFISSVSHELRTPLTSIKGWTETVGNLSDHDDPNFRRGVEIIAGETDRLYSMVEELLDFSRMQNGLTLNLSLLDLAAEVEEAVLFSGQRAANMGLTLEYEAPELPVPVMADTNRLRQVLINILDNGIKYSPENGTIRVDILQDTSSAYVLIADEGPGISQEDLENVKVKFYKGQGAVRGSGIGLAVVDEIMSAHGGGLEITSEQNKGTEVTLRFPLYKKGDKPGEAKSF